MSVNAGDSGCTSGLSQKIFTRLMAEGTRAGFHAAAAEAVKGIAWGVAQGIADELNAGGIVYARAAQNAAQGIFSGADIPVQFQSVAEDTHGGVSLGSDWHYTVPSAGVYQVTAGLVVLGLTAASELFVDLNVNGSALQRFGVQNPTGDTGTAYRGAYLGSAVRLAAGDAVRIIARQTSGVTKNTTGVAVDTFFTIARIGG